MTRYIDADAIKYVDLNADMPHSPIRVYVAFKEDIDNAPTIDAKEVAERYVQCQEFESADAVSEDTQTEERARFVAKETELAHIEARLENAEKRLQGACVANFVAKQLERLKDMTDEERLQLLHTLFPPADREELKERLEEHD